MSEPDEIIRRTAELAELDRQIGIRNVSLATGVPASMLQQATTEDEARAMAAEARAWQRESQPAAPEPIAAVQPYGGVSQFSRQSLAHLSEDQVMALYRQNRLAGIGAPAPGPRNNGEHGHTH